METLYRIEFNEKQQNWHQDNMSHEAETFGWKTISDSATDLEFKILEAYVRRSDPKCKKKLTVKGILKAKSELIGFISNLMEYNINIKH